MKKYILYTTWVLPSLAFLCIVEARTDIEAHNTQEVSKGGMLNNSMTIESSQQTVRKKKKRRKSFTFKEPIFSLATNPSNEPASSSTKVREERTKDPLHEIISCEGKNGANTLEVAPSQEDNAVRNDVKDQVTPLKTMTNIPTSGGDGGERLLTKVVPNNVALKRGVIQSPPKSAQNGNYNTSKMTVLYLLVLCIALYAKYKRDQGVVKQDHGEGKDG